MTKNDVIKYLKENSLSPNKKLGQNFLINEAVCQKISDLSADAKNIIEIGPGLGSLTEFLIRKADSLTVIEIDSGLYSFLIDKFGSNSNINLVHSDFLKYKDINHADVVIGNLPYYCSSEIIFKVIETILPNKMVFMLQTEMAKRITATHNTPEYGALSASLAYYYDSRIEFGVDKHSFYPVPEVSSSIISFTKKDFNNDDNFKNVFHNVIKAAFWGRRKSIVKSLSQSPFLNINKQTIFEILTDKKIDKNLRAENISTEMFSLIAKEIVRREK